MCPDAVPCCSVRQPKHVQRPASRRLEAWPLLPGQPESMCVPAQRAWGGAWPRATSQPTQATLRAWALASRGCRAAPCTCRAVCHARAPRTRGWPPLCPPLGLRESAPTHVTTPPPPPRRRLLLLPLHPVRHDGPRDGPQLPVRLLLLPMPAPVLNHHPAPGCGQALGHHEQPAGGHRAVLLLPVLHHRPVRHADGRQGGHHVRAARHAA